MSTFEQELAALRKDQRNTSLPGLIATWMALPLALALPVVADLPWFTWVALWPLIGWLQYRIVISGHEAVHKTLCYPTGLNEAFGVCGQAIVGVNFAAYRLQHMDHHRATDHASDPDGHIYGGIINTPRGIKRFLVWTLGTLVEILVKIRQKGTGGYGTKRTVSDKVKRDKVLHTGLVFAAQLFIMGMAGLALANRLELDLIALDSVWGVVRGGLLLGFGYFLMWFGPLSVVAVFLNRSRILIEHGLPLVMQQDMDEGWGGLRIPTVDIVPNALERELFSPFLFNYHCCHHLYMAVPHYNLPALRELCIKHKISGYHGIEGSYISALMRTMQT
jgi:fatty acid desaturase